MRIEEDQEKMIGETLRNYYAKARNHEGSLEWRCRWFRPVMSKLIGGKTKLGVTGRLGSVNPGTSGKIC